MFIILIGPSIRGIAFKCAYVEGLRFNVYFIENRSKPPSWVHSLASSLPSLMSRFVTRWIGSRFKSCQFRWTVFMVLCSVKTRILIWILRWSCIGLLQSCFGPPKTSLTIGWQAIRIRYSCVLWCLIFLIFELHRSSLIINEPMNLHRWT